MGQKGKEKFIVILMGNPEWLEEEKIFKNCQNVYEFEFINDSGIEKAGAQKPLDVCRTQHMEKHYINSVNK